MTDNLGGLDAYVRDHFSSSGQALVDAGVAETARFFERPYSGASINEGIKKIKRGIKLGGVDLGKLAREGMDLLKRYIGPEDWENHRAFGVVKDLRQEGVKISNKEIVGFCYEAIRDYGTCPIKAAERVLNISFDATEMAEKAYQAMESAEVVFVNRGMDALIYAERKGATINPSKLPNKEKLVAAIQEEIKLYGRKENALRYLQALQRWGLPVVEPETISRLERVVELERI